MKYLYYCNSAYQLINVLNLHYHRRNNSFEDIEDYSADLMILNAFNAAKKMADIVRKKKIFNKVILIEKTKDNSGVFHILNSFLDIAFPSSYIKKKYNLDSNNLKYDVLTVPKFSRIIGAIWQINKDAELQLYEDGLATYCFDYDLVISRSKSYKLLYKPMNYGRDFLDYTAIYLNMPELFTGDYGERVKEVPRYDKRYLEEVKEYFYEFAKTDIDSGINMFWFSQSMFDDSLVLSVLKEYKKHVLYCPHPRYPLVNDNFSVADKGQIWEMKALHMDNLERCCLISIHSTALLTPKILFDKEPYIIFVYKLVPLPYEHGLFDRTLKLFIEEYGDPNKISIPENIEEFKESIERFLKST